LKQVIIIRHAKSSWSDFSLSDFERPLDTRGLHDAPLMAERLKNLGYLPQKLCSSNAARAKETSQYFSKINNLPIDLYPNLYHGSPEDYIAVMSGLDESISCAAFFGHNPGITYVANLIKPGCTDNIPTCGIIIATFPTGTWAEANWKKMNLVELMYPNKDNRD
jgi:phosphohistidine phosphatase